MDISRIKNFVDSDWLSFFYREVKKPYWQSLAQALKDRESGGELIYPVGQAAWFRVFQLGLRDIKVVIIGQDPYPGEHGGVPFATGLSFSVPHGVRIPMSLRNIFAELGFAKEDVASGDLSEWHKQGVFLLNSILTVAAGPNNAGSHKSLGWQQLTRSVIREVAEQCPGVVFLAWGLNAHRVIEEAGVDELSVIKTSHPSPQGCRRSGQGYQAFLGSGCFERANQKLQAAGLEPIDWRQGVLKN